MTEAYPLQWPAGRPRTSRPVRSRFDTGFAKARNHLVEELNRLGARHAVLSTNVELRLDGLPYANRPEPSDRGAAVYFMHKDRQMAFCCDRWDKVGDNIHAIAKTIEALRGIARWGTGDMMEAAFSGFESLPPPGDDWRAVLNVRHPISRKTIREAYLDAVKRAHPDAGGSVEAFQRVEKAYREALQAIGD